MIDCNHPTSINSEIGIEVPRLGVIELRIVFCIPNGAQARITTTLCVCVCKRLCKSGRVREGEGGGGGRDFLAILSKCIFPSTLKTDRK